MEFANEENYDNYNYYSNDNDAILIDLFSLLYQSFNPEELIVPLNQKLLSKIKKKLF